MINPTQLPFEHYIHRSNWLRAAVLGANDGIISIASLAVGIASAGTERAIRERAWQLLACYFDAESLGMLPVRETGLEGLPEVFAQMLFGRSFGRVVVRTGG